MRPPFTSATERFSNPFPSSTEWARSWARDIDLRLFMSHWELGFAVTDATDEGPRRSLQFFDRDGNGGPQSLSDRQERSGRL